jgi:site-specific recombinase XerD
MEQALSELLERYYIRLLSLERHACLTAETYRRELRLFLSWLSVKGIELERAVLTKETERLFACGYEQSAGYKKPSYEFIYSAGMGGF